jgi:hypothetical protein
MRLLLVHPDTRVDAHGNESDSEKQPNQYHPIRSGQASYNCSLRDQICKLRNVHHSGNPVR